MPIANVGVVLLSFVADVLSPKLMRPHADASTRTAADNLQTPIDMTVSGVLRTEPYLDQTARWPQTGRHVLAQFDDARVVVYQAYRPSI